MTQLYRYNHWRTSSDKVEHSSPHTAQAVLNNIHGEAFSTQDCQADPCNCTGCSEWDG